ncbi:hypothetical protein [Brevibacillus sp. FIR094]|uniref:hypothetical protein n=1 Tax=Brevibacillus sp. FIR094 TaxID=3134809 RepID=UPI003D20CA45
MGLRGIGVPFSISYLLVPLIFNSLKRVQLIANALDAKGFRMRNSQHQFYRSKR